MFDLFVRNQIEPAECVCACVCLSGGTESGGNTAAVLVIQTPTARTVSRWVKQILGLNTRGLTFVEVCLPPTCLISTDFN